MRYFKPFLQIIHKVFIIELIFCFTLIIYFPDKVAEVTGYRLYTVLSDSMEPKIPTYSLVLTKLIPVEKTIQPDTIVTLTHYFRETQIGNDGNTYYRTQAEGKDFFDNYETKRSDIIGEYIYHIPYIGKIFLFLKSSFGLVYMGELFVIYLINILIKTRWKEKEVKLRKQLA